MCQLDNGTKLTWSRLCEICDDLKRPDDFQLIEFKLSAEAQTPANTWAEPDGYDQSGFPSWPLALGLIKPFPLSYFDELNELFI